MQGHQCQILIITYVIKHGAAAQTIYVSQIMIGVAVQAGNVIASLTAAAPTHGVEDLKKHMFNDCKTSKHAEHISKCSFTSVSSLRNANDTAAGEKSSQRSVAPWVSLQLSPVIRPRRSSGHAAEDGLPALRNAQAQYHEDQHSHCRRPETIHSGSNPRGTDSILSCSSKLFAIF